MPFRPKNHDDCIRASFGTSPTETFFFFGIVAVTPPAQRVQFILGEDHDDSAHQPHPLFSEMEELLPGEDGQMEWKETARYFLTAFMAFKSPRSKGS